MDQPDIGTVAADARVPRRRFLQLTGTGGVLFVAGCTSIAGKASKEQVNYQDRPKGAQQCSNCRFYDPPGTDGRTGTCSRVQGDVEPDDWCSVYAEN